MKAVIFGTGDVTQIAAYYYGRDDIAEVVAFTVDEAFIPDPAEFEGRPVVAFETLPARTRQMSTPSSSRSATRR